MYVCKLKRIYAYVYVDVYVYVKSFRLIGVPKMNGVPKAGGLIAFQHARLLSTAPIHAASFTQGGQGGFEG